MTDKRKKRVRAHAAKIGSTYQAASNQLDRDTIEVPEWFLQEGGTHHPILQQLLDRYLHTPEGRVKLIDALVSTLQAGLEDGSDPARLKHFARQLKWLVGTLEGKPTEGESKSSNPIAAKRRVFKKSFDKAMSEMERCWSEDSTKADLASFDFDLRVKLTDGTSVACHPAGVFANTFGRLTPDPVPTPPKLEVIVNTEAELAVLFEQWKTTSADIQRTSKPKKLQCGVLINRTVWWFSIVMMKRIAGLGKWWLARPAVESVFDDEPEAPQDGSSKLWSWAPAEDPVPVLKTITLALTPDDLVTKYVNNEGLEVKDYATGKIPPDSMGFGPSNRMIDFFKGAIKKEGGSPVKQAECPVLEEWEAGHEWANMKFQFHFKGVATNPVYANSWEVLVRNRFAIIDRAYCLTKKELASQVQQPELDVVVIQYFVWP